jgi:predicted dehydrogenase
MWDDAKSGGILVEHGVHFFDAYGQIAGTPSRVWGIAPRREAVQVIVEYARGAIGTYYHEFAFPHAVERTHGMALFHNGYIEIDGWIPERLHGKVLTTAVQLETVARPLQLPFKAWEESDATRFDVQFLDRRRAYQSVIADGMRDLIASHRDPAYISTVSAEDARDSLCLSLEAQRATQTGTSVQIMS